MKKAIIFMTIVLFLTACTYFFLNIKNEEVKKNISLIEDKIDQMDKKEKLTKYYTKELEEIENLQVTKESLATSNNDLENVLKEKEVAINDYKNKIADLNNS